MSIFNTNDVIAIFKIERYIIVVKSFYRVFTTVGQNAILVYDEIVAAPLQLALCCHFIDFF